MSTPSTAFIPVVFGLPSISGELVGREREMELLAKNRKDGRLRSVIQGPVGVGKTALLKAYLHANADVKNRLWFDASSVSALQSQYNALYNQEALETYGEMGESDMRRGIIHLLEHLIEPTIIIYDNAATYKELMPFLPGHGHGLQILISSRQTQWPDLDCLPPLEYLPESKPALNREVILSPLKPLQQTILLAAAAGEKKRSDLRQLLPVGPMASADFNDIIAELKKLGLIEVSADLNKIVTVISPYREALCSLQKAPSAEDESEDTCSIRFS